MRISEARATVAEVDARDLEDRAERFAELSELSPSGLIGTSGQAADQLFSDIKATWIYGYFAATTVIAASFCVQQLSGMLRLEADDPALPESTNSLEEAAALSFDRGIIDIDLRARLVALHDAAQVYSSAGLHQHRRDATQRSLDAEQFAGQEILLLDARSAIQCSISVLHSPS